MIENAENNQAAPAHDVGDEEQFFNKADSDLKQFKKAEIAMARKEEREEAKYFAKLEAKAVEGNLYRAPEDQVSIPRGSNGNEILINERLLSSERFGKDGKVKKGRNFIIGDALDVGYGIIDGLLFDFLPDPEDKGFKHNAGEVIGQATTTIGMMFLGPLGIATAALRGVSVASKAQKVIKGAGAAAALSIPDVVYEGVKQSKEVVVDDKELKQATKEVTTMGAVSFSLNALVPLLGKGLGNMFSKLFGEDVFDYLGAVRGNKTVGEQSNTLEQSVDELNVFKLSDDALDKQQTLRAASVAGDAIGHTKVPVTKENGRVVREQFIREGESANQTAARFNNSLDTLVTKYNTLMKKFPDKKQIFENLGLDNFDKGVVYSHKIDKIIDSSIPKRGGLESAKRNILRSEQYANIKRTLKGVKKLNVSVKSKTGNNINLEYKGILDINELGELRRAVGSELSSLNNVTNKTKSQKEVYSFLNTLYAQLNKESKTLVKNMADAGVIKQGIAKQFFDNTNALANLQGPMRQELVDRGLAKGRLKGFAGSLQNSAHYLGATPSDMKTGLLRAGITDFIRGAGRSRLLNSLTRAVRGERRLTGQAILNNSKNRINLFSEKYAKSITNESFNFQKEAILKNLKLKRIGIIKRVTSAATMRWLYDGSTLDEKLDEDSGVNFDVEKEEGGSEGVDFEGASLPPVGRLLQVARLGFNPESVRQLASVGDMSVSRHIEDEEALMAMQYQIPKSFAYLEQIAGAYVAPKSRQAIDDFDAALTAVTAPEIIMESVLTDRAEKPTEGFRVNSNHIRHLSALFPDISRNFAAKILDFNASDKIKLSKRQKANLEGLLGIQKVSYASAFADQPTLGAGETARGVQTDAQTANRVPKSLIDSVDTNLAVDDATA